MAITLYDQIIFGDTDGTLGRGAVGGDQLLFEGPQTTSLTLVGDARYMIANAIGGDDSLSDTNAASTSILGDAVSLSDHARGGNDLIGAFANGDAAAAGDGLTLSDHSAGGHDTIAAEGGQNALAFGDAETMSGHAHGGDDVITVSASQCSVAYGDAYLMTDHAVGGNDHLLGSVGAENTKLVGDAETMSGSSVGGDDTLTTTFIRHTDTPFHAEYYGDAVVLTDHAKGGNDSLQGSSDFDSLMYGDGQSLLDHASGGNDTLSSAEGSDTMWGDAANIGQHAQTGADLFIVTIGGHDQIMDFEPGKDHIELPAYQSFEEVQPLFQQTAQGVLVAFDSTDDLLIRGVTINQLQSSDFIFA